MAALPELAAYLTILLNRRWTVSQYSVIPVKTGIQETFATAKFLNPDCHRGDRLTLCTSVILVIYGIPLDQSSGGYDALRVCLGNRV